MQIQGRARRSVRVDEGNVGIGDDAVELGVRAGPGEPSVELVPRVSEDGATSIALVTPELSRIRGCCDRWRARVAGKRGVDL